MKFDIYEKKDYKILDKNKIKWKAKNIYGLYQGDKFITTGTAEELAKYLNKKRRNIDSLINKNKKRKEKYINRLIFTKIGIEVEIKI